METAVRHNVPGIDADCGGACSCATCHVFVDEAWQTLLGAPSDIERALLECLDGAQPNSRLSCQISTCANMDGLVLRLPACQR
jgi:2Fe-2S ferredoxin